MRAETARFPIQSQTKVISRDLTSGSIHRAIRLLAPAMMLETAILNVSDLLDTYWVSRLGSAALAAVTVSIATRWLIHSVSMGLGIGGLAVVARRSGAQDREAADHAAAQAILLALAFSILLSLSGLVAARPVLQLMGADASVLPLGLTYLRVTFLGAGTWVLVYVINPLLRGAGEARKPMLVLFLTAGVTIISEPLLVLGVGPFPELGVAGAALSYILGFGAGLILQFVLLFRGRSGISLRLRHLRPDLSLMTHIMRIALPSTGQTFLRSASLMAVFALVGGFGTYATAGYGLADRLLTFALVPCFGLGNAAATLVGQNLGALKPERAERSGLWVAGYTGIYMLIATTALMVFAPKLIALFDATPEVVAIGVQYIRIAALSIFVDSLGFILSRSMEGAGLTVPATIINLLTLWGLQIPLAYALSRWTGLGLAGIWWARALANVANASLFAIVYRRGRWKEREV